MPHCETRHLVLDGWTWNFSHVIEQEGREKKSWHQHPFFLWYFVMVAELGKMKNAGSICLFCRCVYCGAENTKVIFTKVHWKPRCEIRVEGEGVGDSPSKQVVFCGNMGMERTWNNFVAFLWSSRSLLREWTDVCFAKTIKRTVNRWKRGLS